MGVFLTLTRGLYRLRLQQLRRQFNARLEARINERTRIAQDLHDTFFQGIQGLLLGSIRRGLSSVKTSRPGESLNPEAFGPGRRCIPFKLERFLVTEVAVPWHDDKQTDGPHEKGQQAR